MTRPAAPPTGQPFPGASTNLGPTGMNVAPSTPGKVPPVTDDPSVPKGPAASSPTGSTDDLETRGLLARMSPARDNGQAPMGDLPQTPDLGSYLNPALKQYQSDLSGYQQADQANRIDPRQVKPRLWERLAGFGLGMTQLKDPQNAGAVAGEVVNRRREGAEQARSAALAPWTQRLEQDKAGVPLAESAARTAYEQGELGLRNAAENRERFTAQSNAAAKDELNSIRDEWNKDRSAQAEARLNELEKKNKDNLEMQRQILDLKRDMLDYKMSQAGNKGKPGQFAGAESKKAAALQKAKTAYDKETDAAGSDPVARKTADDNFKQAEQDAQDAYEAEVNALGGEASHQNVESWRSQSSQPAGAQAAAAAAPGAKPAAAPSESSAPTVMGPKGETPAKTASDGQAKIGYYKSTGQWMLVPQNSGGK